MVGCDVIQVLMKTFQLAGSRSSACRDEYPGDECLWSVAALLYTTACRSPRLVMVLLVGSDGVRKITGIR